MLINEPRQEETNILISNLVRHKPGCTATEDGQRLEISDLGNKSDHTIYVVKTKALISCVVTPQLSYTFVLQMPKAGFLMMRLKCLISCLTFKVKSCHVGTVSDP